MVMDTNVARLADVTLPAPSSFPTRIFTADAIPRASYIKTNKTTSLNKENKKNKTKKTTILQI